MNTVAHIPTDEILKDRSEAIEDIKNCQRALGIGITTYSGGSVLDRLNANVRQISVMDAELMRREAATVD